MWNQCWVQVTAQTVVVMTFKPAFVIKGLATVPQRLADFYEQIVER